MNDDKHIPEMTSYDVAAEFWDKHSLADFWDETETVEFEVAPDFYRLYLVPVDADLLSRVQRMARLRGVSTESLVNLLLEQRLHQISRNPL